MAIVFRKPNTFAGQLQPKGRVASIATQAALVVLGTLLITLCATINVPVWPVPVTLQSFAVATLAAAFGLRMAVATVALYLLEGAIGLPVFASGGGLVYIAGPTGGFLIGFVLMAAIVGYAADHGASGKPVVLFAAMLAGDAALLAIGFVWLLTLSGNASWIDQQNLIASAFVGAIQPFIVWDILKMALAALTAVAGYKLLPRP